MTDECSIAAMQQLAREVGKLNVKVRDLSFRVKCLENVIHQMKTLNRIRTQEEDLET